MSRHDEIRERCERFWNGESMRRPMVGALYNRMAPLRWFTENLDVRRLAPENLEAALYRGDMLRRFRAAETIGGDTGFVAYPFIGIPWLEAIFGCEVQAAGSSAWPEPLAADWRSLGEGDLQWDNGWFDVLQDEVRIAIDLRDELEADENAVLPIGPCHLRGLGDFAGALAGQTDFCLALYDFPKEIKNLIELGAGAWRRIVEAQFSLIPEDNCGGYWNGNQPLWCPGKSMLIPADVASLVSPEMFVEFFYKPLLQMIDGYDYSIMHTHSTYIDNYPLDMLMAIDELQAVQVGIDTNGPDIESIIPTIQKIAERRRVIVAGTLSADQIRRAMRKLPSTGICFLTYLESIEECREVLEELGIE